MPHVPVPAAALALPERIRGLLASAAIEHQQVELLRRQVEETIAKLIDLLDELDAEDEDLEPDGSEEPTLGRPEGGHVTPSRYGDTRDGEREWSLGSLTSCVWAGSQSFWARGEPSDFEHEHDGREPDEDREQECEDEGADTADDEPWLGALQNVDQRIWAHSGDGWADGGEADDSELEPDNRDLLRTLPPDGEDEAVWARWRKDEDRREREERVRQIARFEAGRRDGSRGLDAILRRKGCMALGTGPLCSLRPPIYAVDQVEIICPGVARINGPSAMP